jgi:alpha-N-arabinofuranosidase
LTCEKYDSKNFTDVPYLETAAVWNEEAKEIIVFAVNRNLRDDIELTCDFHSFGGVSVKEHRMLRHHDLKAVNSAEYEAIKPTVDTFAQKENGKVYVSNLSAASWNVIRFSY